MMLSMCAENDDLRARRINTPEMREKALLTRRSAQNRAIEANVRMDWPDDARWVEMATAHGIRLPQRAMLCTPGSIARYLHRLGLTGAWFRDWCGYNYAGWIAHNKEWSLRALIGLVLEEL